jgi:hypothetical protein
MDYIEPKLTAEGVLLECFRYFAYMDRANAAIHLSEVRYSPITFRCAEHLQHRLAEVKALVKDGLSGDWLLIESVLLDLGAYEEDSGRI